MLIDVIKPEINQNDYINMGNEVKLFFLFYFFLIFVFFTILL
jgi:hypothetical protein